MVNNLKLQIANCKLQIAIFLLISLSPLNASATLLAEDIIPAKITLREDYKIIVNKKIINPDVPPIDYLGIIYVPVRFVSESLGAEVIWSQKEKKVFIKLNNRNIVIKINKTKAIVNENEAILISPPFIYKNRCMIPLKWTTGSLGADVREKEKVMEISYKKVKQEVGVSLSGKGKDKKRPEIMLKTKQKKQNKDVGWLTWLRVNLSEKIKFVFVHEVKINTQNKIMAPLVIFLWICSTILFSSQIIKKKVLTKEPKFEKEFEIEEEIEEIEVKNED
jgi:hypothetical protein